MESPMTLTEIERAAEARRERAWKHEHARNRLTNVKARVTQLEATLATPDAGLDALRRIHALAGDIPEDCVTRGDRFTPGGCQLRSIVVREVGFALEQRAAKRKALEDELPVARQKLTEAEAAVVTARRAVVGTGTATLPSIKARGSGAVS